MPIDPVIAQGFRGIELQNPLDTFARVNQLQQAQQQSQLNALKMQEYQRDMQEQQEVRNRLAGGARIDSPDMSSFLLGSKTGRDILQRQTDLQKATTEEQARRAKLAADTEAMYRNMSQVIGTKDDAASFLQRMVTDPALKGSPIATIPLEQQIARIPDDPAALNDWVKQFAIGSTKWVTENKPSTQLVNRGGQSDIVQIPGLGGAPATVGTYADVPLPPTVAAQKIAAAKAGAPVVDLKVNAYVPASEQAQKDYIGAISDERKALRNAPDALKNIEAAKRLIPSASTFMGKGGEPLLAAASFLNNRLGTSISTQGVTDATVLRTRLFEGILENLKKLDSQPSQEQQRVLSEALGNLGTDPAALGQILDRIGETVRDRVDRYNTDVDEAEKRGVKFPFEPQLKLPGAPSVPAAIPTAAPAVAPTSAAPAAQPIYARNPTTGQRIMSVDGGINWIPAR